MKKKGIIKLVLSFLIPFIAGLILFPEFFNLELTSASVGLIAVYAFVIFAVVGIYRKEGHQGQIPIWIGITMIAGALLAMGGSLGWFGGEKIIELDARSQGFALIGLAIGVMFLMSGLKAMNQFSYGLGNIKSRK